jgi:hypothetical protein
MASARVSLAWQGDERGKGGLSAPALPNKRRLATDDQDVIGPGGDMGGEYERQHLGRQRLGVRPDADAIGTDGGVGKEDRAARARA